MTQNIIIIIGRVDTPQAGRSLFKLLYWFFQECFFNLVSTDNLGSFPAPLGQDHIPTIFESLRKHLVTFGVHLFRKD